MSNIKFHNDTTDEEKKEIVRHFLSCNFCYTMYKRYATEVFTCLSCRGITWSAGCPNHECQCSFPFQIPDSSEAWFMRKYYMQARCIFVTEIDDEDIKQELLESMEIIADYADKHNTTIDAELERRMNRRYNVLVDVRDHLAKIRKGKKKGKKTAH